MLWEQETQRIFWTDINRFLVHGYWLQSGTLKTWFFSEPVTCVMATDRKDTFALCLGSGIVLWKPDSPEAQTRVFSLPGWPFVRCNDAAVDPGGVLWLGTMRNNVLADGAPEDDGGKEGVLYRVEGTGAASEWRHGLGISNTLVWSPDQSRFYFGDSLQNCIWSYEYDATGKTIRGEQPFFQDFERGSPDGSTMDAEGFLWNCRYGGGCLVRIAPNGEVDRVIEMPVSRPTNCTFGGPHGNVLYVTSASPAAGHWERFGGGLFSLETNVVGLRENRWMLPD